MKTSTWQIRLAKTQDLDSLVRIEKACFNNDKLSRRSLKNWITAAHGILMVGYVVDEATEQEVIKGYGLVWCHKGTRLARLYSLAVNPDFRGHGLADRLITALEDAACEQGRIYMRLEVEKNNHPAIKLYQRQGYTVFGEYTDYYEDHSDALRMQKRIMFLTSDKLQRPTPWYRQTTEFTCGPASLMMAMSSLKEDLPVSQTMELDIWRTATTIFMTSGHGGCHPIGLALAAKNLGFTAEVYINTENPLFVESVRSEHKRDILRTVHKHFVEQAQQENITLNIQDIKQDVIEEELNAGKSVVMLISTYQLDGRKAPHWVCITGVDDKCFYVHDPDPDDNEQAAIDCQHLPIAKEDFDNMSVFGVNRIRTAIIIS